MQSTFIRSLGLPDIQALVPLFDAYRQFYRQPQDRIAAEKFIRERLKQSEAVIYGYFNNDQLVGFTLLYPLFSSVRMKPFYLLNDLFVLPEFRNNQVGSALLRHCQSIARSKNHAGIMLETEITNEIGNHVYPAVGFEKIDTSNFYFWENKPDKIE
jgi:GNAT superfamily N-acetyltransferase